MTFFSLSHHPHGYRVHVLERRVHHGLFGLVLALVGLGLVWHDRADRYWIRDY